MKAPWRDKTGLAKWVAIFATTLGVATGLCALNPLGFAFAYAASGTNAFWGRVCRNVSDGIECGCAHCSLDSVDGARNPPAEAQVMRDAQLRK
jgi:hypothetical protein